MSARRIVLTTATAKDHTNPRFALSRLSISLPRLPANITVRKCELTVTTDEGLDRRHYKHTCPDGLVCLITNEYHGFDGDTDVGVCINAADVEKLCRKRDDYDPKKERQPFAVAQYYNFQHTECEYVWVDYVASRKTRGPVCERVDRSGPDWFKFCAAKDITHETLEFTPSDKCAEYTKEFAKKFAAYTKPSRPLLGFPQPSLYDSKPAYCTGSETANLPCGPSKKACICSIKGDQCKTKEGFQADIDAKNAREKNEKRSRAEVELESYDGELRRRTGVCGGHAHARGGETVGEVHAQGEGKG
ncbi:unnamed protein product [Vitrella brassicaformis CCMP3155]|uniref:Uncharacterized protein n=1 Tax=Vitrella brassicaformis (strain CCMP3155) TaxID=1169540 RepID=A0A0G4F8W5_VITBC|nr:unnamed protein product [Vitrella brassicaformis CCMP3155]|eukprot:CEM09018.1 unnamed protein product [Vitrella brassicaformis CCMP3155]